MDTRSSEAAPLELLDPSPVEETPISSEEKGYFPPQSATPSTTLGLRTHRVSHYREPAPSPAPLSVLIILPAVQLTHRYSSYIFSAFVAAHATNTALLPLLTRSSYPLNANRYLLLTRPCYQSALAEPLVVIAPLATHILSGILLRLHRRRILLDHRGATSRADRSSVPWPRLSWTSIAGYAAIPLVLGHAALTRGLPLNVEGGSSGIGLDSVGHGVAVAPLAGYVGFVALVGVAGSHVVWGWAHWLGLAPADAREGEMAEVSLRRKRRWWGTWAAAAGVVGLWMAGGVGIVARGGKVGGWVGRNYDELYRHVPLLKSWV